MYEGDGFAVAHANFAAPLGMDYIHDRFEAGSALGGGAHLLLRRELLPSAGVRSQPTAEMHNKKERKKWMQKRRK